MGGGGVDERLMRGVGGKTDDKPLIRFNSYWGNMVWGGALGQKLQGREGFTAKLDYFYSTSLVGSLFCHIPIECTVTA